MLLELRGKRLMGTVILGYHKKPARILIDSVDDSWSYCSINGRERISTVIHYSIDERATGISDSRMHNHAAWLFNHYYILIFINYIYWNIFRGSVYRLRLWNGYHDGFARLDFVLLGNFPSRDADQTVLDEVLSVAPREVGRFAYIGIKSLTLVGF